MNIGETTSNLLKAQANVGYIIGVLINTRQKFWIWYLSYVQAKVGSRC